MSWKFTNFPRQYKAQDYEQVLKKIQQRYQVDNVVALYDWGSPSHPGISDIDVLLVWKSSPRPLPMQKRSFIALDAQARYLLRHPLMHITEEDFSSLKVIYPNTKVRNISGKKLHLKPLKKEERKEILLAVLNDIIIRHYPRDMLQSCTEKKLHVRDALLRLNSLKYTFRTLQELGTRAHPSWTSFTKKVQALREEWFENPDTGQLAQLAEESVEIMMEIIEKSRNLLKNRFLSVEYPDTLEFSSIKNHTMFVKDWNNDDALRHMTKTLQDTNTYQSVLPMELAGQLIFYSQQQGRISSHIKKHLSALPPIKEKNTILAKRIKILNNQAELASKLNHSDFPAFFDFGYRSQSGINNIALHMWDRIRKK